jgi:hypothetical protein
MKTKTVVLPAVTAAPAQPFSFYQNFWLPAVIGGTLLVTAAWTSFLGYLLFHLIEGAV